MRIDLTTIVAGAGGLLVPTPSVAIEMLNPLGDIDGDGLADYGVTALSSFSQTTLFHVFRSSTQSWTQIVRDIPYDSNSGLLSVSQNSKQQSISPIVALGDVNGDGLADFGLGAADASGSFWSLRSPAITGSLGADGIGAAREFTPGQGFVITSGDVLGPTLNLSTVVAGNGGYAVTGRAGSPVFGSALSLSRSDQGDFNGDGLNDLIFAAPEGISNINGRAQTRYGEIIVQFGSTTVDTGGKALLASTLAAGNGGFLYRGAENAGNSVNPAETRFSERRIEGRLNIWPTFIGDVNGDGYADMAIRDASRVSILYGRAGDGTSFLQGGEVAPDVNLRLLEGYYTARAAGDLNGDGYDDIVALGGPTGLSILYGSATGLRFGFAVTQPAARIGDAMAAGDLNGDGYADLIFRRENIFSPTNDPVFTYDEYVLFGGPTLPSDRLSPVAAAEGAGGLTIAITSRLSTPIQMVRPTPAGDTNGDGYDDLLAPDPVDLGLAFRVVHGADFSGVRSSTATSGADTLVGTAGDDFINGQGGADVLRGAAGNDTLFVADTSFRLVDGGPGFDTLYLTGSNLTLSIVPPGPHRIKGIEAMDLTGDSITLRVSALGILNLSETSNTLTVNGSLDDRVEIVDGGWLRGASSDGFTTFTKGQAVLRLVDDLAPTNAPGSSRAIGTAAAETITGSAGHDTLDGGGGADSIAGLDGDDLISVAGAGFARVEGGAGKDTLMLAGRGLTLDLTKLATNALTGIEVVELGAGRNTLLLTAATVMAVTDGAGTLRVTGAPGDALGFLDGGWTLSNSAPDAARYTKGDATVLLEREIAGTRVATGTLQEVVAQGGGFTFTGVAAGDRAGTALALGDLNGDGFADLVVGAPGANGGQGAVYVVWGAAGGLTGPINLAAVAAGTGGFVIEGGSVAVGGSTLGTTQGFGQSLALLDTNRDGLLDLVIGAPGYDSTGAARLAEGRFDQHGQLIYGYDEFGYPIIVTDDPFNGDVGMLPTTRTDTGAIFARLGAAGQPTTPLSLSSLAAGTGGWMIEGQFSGAGIGRDIQATGDYDRDGAADFVFSWSVKRPPGPTDWAQIVYVPFAALTGIHVIRGDATAPAGVRDFAAADMDGWAIRLYRDGNENRSLRIAAIGDVNRDGGGDVFAAGGDPTSSASASPLFPGIFSATAPAPSPGSPLANRLTLDSMYYTAPELTNRSISFETFQREIFAAPVGDVDGDGIADFLYGVPYASKSGTAERAGAGIATLVFTSAGLQTRVDSNGASFITGARIPSIAILGETVNGRAGSFVGAAGDVNGDGLSDMLVGNAAGDLFVVFGSRSFSGLSLDLADVAQGYGGFVLRGALSGGALVTPGDVNADGFGDLIFGNPAAGSNAGAITVFYGRDFTLAQAQPSATLARNQVGGAGNDVLFGGRANDQLSSPAGRNLLTGFDGDDTLTGGDGMDMLEGGRGNDVMDGGGGVDTATYASAESGVGVNLALSGPQFTSGAGTDTLLNIENVIGSPFEDGLIGNAGPNSLASGAGNDMLLGGEGNDTLNGGRGADSMEGGAGDDLYYVDSTSDVVTELPGGGRDRVIASVNWTLAAEVERLSLTGTANLNGTGNGLANRLDGNAGANILSGEGGLDALYGLGGDDTLLGGEGNDTLDGGTGVDSMEGGAGNDTYSVDNTDDQVIELAGGGYDRVIASISWTLGDEVERLSLTGTADLSGTGNGVANRLDGNAGANLLSGEGGFDALYGLGGNDTLLGGEGNDTLDGGTGVDSMEGGAGNDTYSVDNTDDLVIELAGGGYDHVVASVGWTLGDEVERLSLTGTADLSGTGNAVANRLDGNAGANLLSGESGHDVLNGFAGSDTLLGGEGNDTLDGGTGADSLVGGLDADVFLFRLAAQADGDIIADFNAAEGDRIDLRRIDANENAAGNQAFAWIGGSSFTEAARQLRFADGLLSGDLNGDGIADFEITLSGASSLTAANIWL
jgi:Ca2+-binding RTX toxin-like protein